MARNLGDDPGDFASERVNVAQQLAAFGETLATQTSRFLPDTYTVATLPLASANPRKYAWVTDLHDGQPDYVISDGANWKPVRPLAARFVSNANAAMTLQCLANSPTQILRGTLSAARNLTLSTTMAYSGARFRIKREAGGLFGINVVGLITTVLGTGVSPVWMDMEYSAGDNGWVQTASGGLL